MHARWAPPFPPDRCHPARLGKWSTVVTLVARSGVRIRVSLLRLSRGASSLLDPNPKSAGFSIIGRLESFLHRVYPGCRLVHVPLGERCLRSKGGDHLCRGLYGFTIYIDGCSGPREPTRVVSAGLTSPDMLGGPEICHPGLDRPLFDRYIWADSSRAEP